MFNEDESEDIMRAYISLKHDGMSVMHPCISLRHDGMSALNNF